LGITHKTVSKWECGMGSPDLTYWPELSSLLGVDMAQLMEGEMALNKPDSGNIAKIRFYVCSSCGNILVSTGGASIVCCGRKLERLSTSDPAEHIKIAVEELDDDCYITLDHPMTKKHFIVFAAYVKSDTVFLRRLYPEQSPSFHMPRLSGGTFYLYCVEHGLSVYPKLF
ncbi:MAG: helix-turn-helix protein, partial [Oscillospiraceae bacterium]|nr:helix-turn-helix protein [Oscillospiraceae bacterium]